jgi:hypothetical protein
MAWGLDHPHARFATSGPRARGGEQGKQSTVVHPWDAGSAWAAQQGRTGPLAAPCAVRPAAPAPAAQAAGERRGRPYVSALLTAKATATHRYHGIDT